MRFAIFPVHTSKVLRLPRKSEARSYEVLHLSCKIILANLKISRSKKQPLSENLRPDLLTHLPRLLYCACHAKCIFPDPLQMSHAIVSETATKPWRFAHVLLTFDKVHNPLRLPRKTTSERPKVFRTPFFCIFDFEMCFAPQRRTLFR